MCGLYDPPQRPDLRFSRGSDAPASIPSRDRSVPAGLPDRARVLRSPSNPGNR